MEVLACPFPDYFYFLARCIPERESIQLELVGMYTGYSNRVIESRLLADRDGH